MPKPEDPFEKRPVKAEGPKHKRLDGGESGDYFCMNCGAPITTEEGLSHGPGKCEANPELVFELRNINLW